MIFWNRGIRIPHDKEPAASRGILPFSPAGPVLVPLCYGDTSEALPAAAAGAQIGRGEVLSDPGGDTPSLATVTGTFEDIRIAHADTISKMNCDGYAVGGLAVGESHEEMYRILDAVVPHLPEEKPTYLMGVGTPANILEAVDRGVDFFDCVYPTRNGRHGHVYTNHGKINLFNEQFSKDMRPIEEGCQCPACRSYSRAYIRHLLKAKEMLGMRLCVLHNLYFYNTMMTEIREAIENHCYAEYKEKKLEGVTGNYKDKV